MGIQDRDYYREGSSFLDAWNRQGWTVWLIAITCGVFFGQCITGLALESPLVELGAYQPHRVMEGEVWRLFTAMFLHAGLWHLFFNMFLLYWAGTRMEEVYSRGEFVAFYLVAGVMAQCFYLAAWAAGFAPANPSVGASGAVIAVLVLFAFHFPRHVLWIYGIIPMQAWVLVALYFALDLLGAVGVRGGRTAYFVHIGGALFAAAYYQTGFRFAPLFARSRRESARRVRPRLRVIPAEPEDATPTPVGAAVESPPRPKEAGEPKEPGDEQLEKRVDQVLAKVSKYGQESLTPEEREILFKASELYKKRRK